MLMYDGRAEFVLSFPRTRDFVRPVESEGVGVGESGEANVISVLRCMAKTSCSSLMLSWASRVSISSCVALSAFTVFWAVAGDVNPTALEGVMAVMVYLMGDGVCVGRVNVYPVEMYRRSSSSG